VASWSVTSVAALLGLDVEYTDHTDRDARAHAATEPVDGKQDLAY